MTRIAVGGFLHETNTFAPTKATYDAFVHGGGWPSMSRGADILALGRINVGLAGFIEAAQGHGWELAPTIFTAATPSAHVTKDAYERIAKVMVDGIVGPWFFEPWPQAAAARSVDLRYVVLRPDEETAVARALGRTGAADLTDEGPVRTMWRHFADLGPFEAHALDTSGQTASESCAAVKAALAVGRLRLADA